MTKPRIYKPAFTLGGIVPPKLLVDRTEQMEELEHILTHEKGNVLLVGDPRLGKTSLIYKLIDHLEEQKAICFSADLRIYYDRHVTSFLRELLNELCCKVGQVIFQKTTSDMFMAARQKPKTLGGDFNRLIEIYRYLKAQESTWQQGRVLDVGASSPLVGKIQDSTQTQLKFNSFSPSDFVHLIRDLRSICRDHGYVQIVVFADEANNLAVQTSYEILGSYLAAFKQRDVQIPFLFVATPSILSSYPEIEVAFDRTIRVSRFSDANVVMDLLTGYYRSEGQSQVPFMEEAVKALFWTSKGNPYLCQLLCDRSVDIANSKDHDVVHSEDVLFAFVKELQRDSSLIAFWK